MTFKAFRYQRSIVSDLKPGPGMKRHEFISITKKDFVIADQSGDFYETRLKESERFERIQEEPQCQLLRVFPRFRLIQDDRGGVCESLRSLASRPTSVGTRISKFPRLNEKFA